MSSEPTSSLPPHRSSEPHDASPARQSDFHKVLARPGDFVTVVSIGHETLGQHTYRVERDGKLRRSSGSRHGIKPGGGEAMELPPL